MEAERRDRNRFLLFVAFWLLLIVITSVTIRLRSTDFTRLNHNERWAADLLQVQNDLLTKHPKYASDPQASSFLTASIREIITAIPRSSDRELLASLTQLLNRELQDSHTFMHNWGTFYPVSFFIFAEGVYVKGATPLYRDLVASELLKVNGIPIDEVLSSLSFFVSGDNPWIRQDQLAKALSDPFLLYLAGVTTTQREAITYYFADVAATIVPVNLRSAIHQEVIYTVSTLEQPTDYSQYGNANYYWHIFFEDHSCYLRLSRCRNDPKTVSFSSYIHRVFAEMDEQQAPRLIIDLRENSGGYLEPILQPLLREINQRPWLVAEEALQVIIGRSTYSGAMLLAAWLKEETGCLLVGEATGQAPSFYAGSVTLRTRYYGISWACATYAVSELPSFLLTSAADALYPDVVLELQAGEWFKGNDQFLASILK
ncbi:MAG: S41 family peptidase [Symbiobacteriaceae bacterium]|nr:S41 family peptidase [Symbiobacteriaceae bacterium]